MSIKQNLLLIILLASPALVFSQPGQLKWSYDFEEPPATQLAIGINGDIYIITGSSNPADDLRELKVVSSNGQSKWTYETPDSGYFLSTLDLHAPAIAKDGSIHLIERINNTPFDIEIRLSILDTNSSVKWNYNIGRPVDALNSSAPNIFNNGDVIVGQSTLDPSVYRFTKYGELVDSLTFKLPDKPHFGSHYFGTIIASTSDRNTYFLLKDVHRYLGSGVLISLNESFIKDIYLELSSSDPEISTISIDRFKNIYFVVFKDRLSGEPKTGYLLTSVSGNGEINWELEGNFKSPVIDSNQILFTSQKDTLYAIESATGKTIWKKTMPATITSDILIGDAALYFATKDSSVVAFSSNSQSILWSYKTEAQINKSPTMNDKGILYVIDENGKLYALQTESSNLDFGNWPKFQHDAQNTGTIELMNPNSVKAANGTTPIKIELHQNYPNPFNAGTTISFNLPQAAHVILTIFNIKGQQVDTIINQPMTPGEHNLNWSAGGLPSGIYYYQIQAGKFVETRKLVYLK